MTLTSTLRELVTYAVLCMLLGAAIAVGAIIGIHGSVAERHRQELSRTAEIERAKGTMVTISRRKLNCAVYELP